MPDWREMEERRVSIFSSPPASWTFARCRARYMGNNSYNREVSQRLFLLCSGLPLQPKHPCLLTSSAEGQQPQIASWDLFNGSLWGGGSAPAAQERGDFIAHVWLPCYACISCRVTMCKLGECFSCFLTLLLCRGTGETTSSPLSLGTLPPNLTRELQVFLFSGGKFHLTLSSGTRTDIRFVDDEVLLSEFNKRGTMKRLQLLSKSTAPIREFIYIYKWHISEGSPHPSKCTPSTENLLIFPSALHALHTFGKKRGVWLSCQILQR